MPPLSFPTLLLLALATIACGPTPSAAVAGPTFHAPDDAPTDETACKRLCAALDACHAADAQCEEACGKDLPWARQGLMSSATACTEDELRSRGCGEGQKTARERARRCYLAAMSAYGERDGGVSFRRVAEASCRKSERCRAGERSVDPADVMRCTDVSVSRAKGTSAPLLLGAASEARIFGVATCVEASPCAERESIARCLAAPTVLAAGVTPASSASPVAPAR